ncbi:hypothetical protein DER45DRAFT_590758 [Fusarium avenaceum]|nr:hypothetical protein DER45DRAFT_590758 [Fusarium avenaceum]
MDVYYTFSPVANPVAGQAGVKDSGRSTYENTGVEIGKKPRRNTAIFLSHRDGGMLRSYYVQWADLTIPDSVSSSKLKCDLSRPACRQCRRAGSRCNGYREDKSVTFRDQTTETLDKMSFFSNRNPRPSSLNSKQGVSTEPGVSQQVKVYQSRDRPSHCPWFRLAVTPEEQALNFYFHHYVVHESGRTPTHPDCQGIIYKRATEPGYFANLIHAVGLSGLAYTRNAPKLTHAATQAFSRALRGICATLLDPSEASSDQMLVAVMLLALYETASFNSPANLSSWSRHVDGALALIRLRGAGQLRNRIGRSIFLHLRTEILIDCLQRGLRVPIILTNSMAEARNNETAQEAPASRLADIIIDACDVTCLAREDVTDEINLSIFVTRLLSIDTDLNCWAQTLPSEYEYMTQTCPQGLREAELYMGRYDMYSSAEIANTWNLYRCTRIILRQTLIEAVLKFFPTPSSPSILPFLPVAYRDLLHISDKIIQETSSDICYSAAYILHNLEGADKPSDLRVAYAVHLLWPLSVAGRAHTATDTLRGWVISTMETIRDATGIQKAKRIALNLQR